MRAISGMTRSDNGRPELTMTVGASLLANGAPGSSSVGRFASNNDGVPLAPTKDLPGSAT